MKKIIKERLGQFSGQFAVLAIGLSGIYILWGTEQPKEIAAGILIATFIVLSFVYDLPVCDNLSTRRRSLYFLVQTAIVSAILLLVPWLNFFAIWFYFLSIGVLMTFKKPVSYYWVAGFAIATVVVLGITLDLVNMLVSIPIYLAGFLFFISFAQTTAEAEDAKKESQRLLEELRVVHRQLQEYASQAENLGVSEERNRLAREMHDTVGHRLTVASVQLEGAGKLIESNPPKAAEMIETVRQQVRVALTELRQTVATLREPLEADLPLKTSLKKLVAGFENATSITIHLALPDQFPNISNAHRLAIYRTAQEALTNVQKHARAQQVWMQVERQGNMLTLRVSDNGTGLATAPEEKTGFGLRGIRERAAQLDGELFLEPRPGGGLQIVLRLPLTA